MLDLTIAIPVRNEEKNLPLCLEAIGNGFAKNIVVIDSGSIDDTKMIAKEHGATVVDFVWDGRFPKKRNWFLRQHTPATEWVLFIDADEYLTEDFKREVTQALQNGKAVGYWLSYTIYFMGRRMKGGYPLRKLALFKVSAGEYERIDEEAWSHLDMEVHEHPILEGKTGAIKSKIDHRDFRDVGYYIAKHNDYAAWEAARFLKSASNEKLRKAWTWKQRLKYRLMSSVWIGPAYFVGAFFLLGGFRDGSRGLAFALLKAAYFNQIYCRIKEQKKAAQPTHKKQAVSETSNVESASFQY